MDLISKLRPTKKAAPDPNAHHSLDGDEDVPEEYLHPCCQKELQADRKKNYVLGKLREGDRARIALEQRRTALGLTSLPTDGEHVHQHVSGASISSYGGVAGAPGYSFYLKNCMVVPVRGGYSPFQPLDSIVLIIPFCMYIQLRRGFEYPRRR
jgi:hypothetical protein